MLPTHEKPNLVMLDAKRTRERLERVPGLRRIFRVEEADSRQFAAPPFRVRGEEELDGTTHLTVAHSEKKPKREFIKKLGKKAGRTSDVVVSEIVRDGWRLLVGKPFELLANGRLVAGVSYIGVEAAALFYAASTWPATTLAALIAFGIFYLPAMQVLRAEG
ncbi:MAG: hypothetical protein Q7R74_00005, partial [bacterium]|nr:hypothetical protein [bacterium]